MDAAVVGVVVMDPAISEAIKSTVDASVGRLTDSLAEEIEARLGSFAKRFSGQNGVTVEQAVKKARVKTIHVKGREINSSLITSSRCWINLMRQRVL